jgi:tetratricopeptide (TPR) repeat protein
METFARSVRPVRGDIQAKYDLARHFQRVQHHTIAIETLKEILRVDPGHADAHNALGYSFDCIGDLRTAQQHYRIAVALNPDLDYAYNNLGYSFILGREYSAAVAALEQAVALRHDRQKYIKNLSYAYYKSGNLKMANITLRGLDDPAAAHRIKVRLGMVSETAEPAGEQKQRTGDGFLSVGNDHRLSKPVGRLSGIRTSEDDPSYLPFLPEPAAEDEPTYLPLLSGRPDHRKTSDPRPEELIESWTDRVILGLAESPPSGAAIEVSNGNGVPRMAGSVGNYLKRRGMRVARLSNADHFHYPRTVIYYRDGYLEAASEVERLLSGLSPGGHLVAAHLDREPIRVLIGRDLAPYSATAYRNVDVDVTNGNGIDGLAGRLSRQLRREGFRVGRLSNADHFSFEKSVVFYGKGQAGHARLIADALPGGGRYRLIELNDAGMHIQVFMGADMIN